MADIVKDAALPREGSETTNEIQSLTDKLEAEIHAAEAAVLNKTSLILSEIKSGETPFLLREKDGINRYQLIDLIKNDGLSTVFKAKDKFTDKNVIIKTPNTENAKDEEDVKYILELFDKEGDAMAMVPHPNIVHILDKSHARFPGDDPGSKKPFIALPDLTEAQTVKSLVFRGGRMEPNDVLKLAKDVGSAIDYASSTPIVFERVAPRHYENIKAIVHRDIKPGNILYDGKKFKVFDFGLVGVLDERGVVGTPEFISPEAIQGEGIDGRADLFSLAGTLYNALTGDIPFGEAGDDPLGVIVKVIKDDFNREPLKELFKDNPYGYKLFEEFFKKALAKEPDNRFQSGKELAAALEKAVKGANFELHEGILNPFKSKSEYYKKDIQ